MEERKVKIINLTPHSVNIKGYGEVLPSGIVPRAKQKDVKVGSINGIPIYRMEFKKEVKDMPPSKEDTVYIVSALTAQALGNDRNDVFIPAHPIRDGQGKIVGCEALARI